MHVTKSKIWSIIPFMWRLHLLQMEPTLNPVYTRFQQKWDLSIITEEIELDLFHDKFLWQQCAANWPSF